MANADLAYQHALDHLAAAGFESLSERERDLVVLWQVEAEVNNGGFELYYSGAAGDLAFHAPEALARVGALEKAAIVGAANALFGPAGPPRDRAERLRAVALLRASPASPLTNWSGAISRTRMTSTNSWKLTSVKGVDGGPGLGAQDELISHPNRRSSARSGKSRTPPA